jgi:DNA-binding transcriptional LysR family regulator
MLGMNLLDPSFDPAVDNHAPLVDDSVGASDGGPDHLLLSMSSSRSDEVDEALASRDLARRIVMRVPHALAAVIALLRSDMLASVTRGAAHIFGEIVPLVRVELPFSVPAAEFRLVWNRRLHHSPGHTWLRRKFVAIAGTTTLADYETKVCDCVRP